MITIYRNARRIIKNVPDFCGLSSDEKPMDAKNGSTFLEIDTGNTFKFDEEGKNWYEQPQSGGGSGGTTDYTQLENKPSINGITLEGNQTTEELDIIPVVDLGEISGKPPIQITLNAEQRETMLKDNCIVTASHQDQNLCLRKIGNSDTQIVFSEIVYDRSICFFVSGLQGSFNVFDIAQIPLPTGQNDAGKVPTVNGDGTGYVLKAVSGGETEIVIPEETVLASGSIPAGTLADTKTDTGLTVDDLRKWKMFAVYIRSGSNLNWGVLCGNNRIAYLSHSSIKYLIEWVDTVKTATRYTVMQGTGYEEQDTIKNQVSAQTASISAYIGEVPEMGSVYIYNHEALRADSTWSVKGVLKYEP